MLGFIGLVRRVSRVLSSEEEVKRVSRRQLIWILPFSCSIGLPACGGDGDGAAPGLVQSRAQLGEATVQIVAQVSGVSLETGQYEAFGAGSGFIIDPSGIVVTNNHVVAGAAGLRVFIGERSDPVNARVIARSECNDLAVLDLEGDGYQYLNWHQGPIERGLSVQSVGYPLGNPILTLTQGIISKPESPVATGWASVTAALEHDARINPGNSGGPLIATEGFRVLGVNYAGDTMTDQNLAISVAEARPIVEQLREGINVDSVGINGVAIDVEEATGVWVESTTAGSPASRAGILPGDFVTTVGGITAGRGSTMEEYCQVIRTRGADGVIEIQVYRPSTGQIFNGELNGAPLVSATPPPDPGNQVGSETQTPIQMDDPDGNGNAGNPGGNAGGPGGEGPMLTPDPVSCSDACPRAGDGVCDDGRPGAASAACAAGTDCSDCETGTDWFFFTDTESTTSCEVINGADFEAIESFPGRELVLIRVYLPGNQTNEADALDPSVTIDANANLLLDGAVSGVTAQFASTATGDRRLWALTPDGTLLSATGAPEFQGLTPAGFNTAACNACGIVDAPHPIQMCQ